MTKYIIIMALPFFITGCQTYIPVTITNHSAHSIVVQFQSNDRDDTTSFSIPFMQDRIIESGTIVTEPRDEMSALKSIIIRTDSTNNVSILRFSLSYLELKNWTIKIPFTASDSMKYSKMETPDQIRAVDNDSFYYLVQELYNAGRYLECIKAVNDAQDVLLLRAATMSRNPQVDGMSRRALAEERKGFMLLGYLSAIKVRDFADADHYWDLLSRSDPIWVKFLQLYDHEISSLRAG